MKKVWLRLLVVLISVMGTLLLCELAVKVFYSFRFEPKGTADIYAPWLYRLSEDKHLSYELKPESKARIQGVSYEINAFGFRDKPYRIRKAAGKRIIFVGDSLTFGWDLPLENTYHKRLEALMGAQGYSVDVFGMGVVGYNTVQEYYLIDNSVAQFEPDMVILQICPNDFERQLGIKVSPGDTDFVLTPYFDFSIPYVVKKGRLSRFLMQNSSFFRFINLKISWIIKKRNEGYAPKEVHLLGEEKSMLYLKKIKKMLDRVGIPLAAVFFPFRQDSENYVYASLQKRVQSVLEELNIPCLDLYDEFNVKLKGKDVWLDALHPNALGYDAAARRLLEFLTPKLF